MPDLCDILTVDVVAALERSIDAHEERASLSATVNSILTDWLSGHGYLPIEELPEGEN